MSQNNIMWQEEWILLLIEYYHPCWCDFMRTFNRLRCCLCRVRNYILYFYCIKQKSHPWAIVKNWLPTKFDGFSRTIGPGMGNMWVRVVIQNIEFLIKFVSHLNLFFLEFLIKFVSHLHLFVFEFFFSLFSFVLRRWWWTEELAALHPAAALVMFGCHPVLHPPADGWFHIFLRFRCPRHLLIVHYLGLAFINDRGNNLGRNQRKCFDSELYLQRQSRSE